MNCFSGPPSSVSYAPHLSFFSDLNKKKVASFIFFKSQNQNIGIFMLKLNKKGASLCFDQIKNKKVASSVFWKIKNKNKNLPATSVFQKWPEKHLFNFFSLIYHHQHHIDVYVLIFSQVHIKVFFTYDTMAERTLGSFDSLTFCGFWGAMPPRPPLYLFPICGCHLIPISLSLMHRLYILFRPDHLIIRCCLKNTLFLIRENK